MYLPFFFFIANEEVPLLLEDFSTLLIFYFTSFLPDDCLRHPPFIINHQANLNRETWSHSAIAKVKGVLQIEKWGGTGLSEWQMGWLWPDSRHGQLWQQLLKQVEDYFKVYCYFLKKYLSVGSDGKSKMSPQWLCNKCRTYYPKNQN